MGETASEYEDDMVSIAKIVVCFKFNCRKNTLFKRVEIYVSFLVFFTGFLRDRAIIFHF